MLTHLAIRDFAIIEAVELELECGLTALTGETGAGKSILVDAVLLAIGGRAAADAVRHGAERAEITATFDVAGNPAALAWLAEQSIDADGEVLLRRVITADGRSRSYINGQPFPAQSARALGECLIEVHGQQEFLSLTRKATQRSLVDEHGEHAALLAPVRELARQWQRLADQRTDLAAAAADRAARLELLRYQVDELEALALKPGDIEQLLAEQQRLAHAGRLAEAARCALAFAYEGDGSDAHAAASRAAAQLRGVLAHDAELAEPLARLEEALIALKDAGQTLGGYLDGLEVDPARQDLVERRVAAIEELARKHRVEPEALVDQLERLRGEADALARAESTLAGLDQQIAAVAADYGKAAGRLSNARRKAAKALAVAVTDLMRVLGMPGGEFAIRVEPTDGALPLADGLDAIEFLVSANPGQPPKPVARVASGGELSRISLAVQVAAASASQQLCMIFDEIDAGVGGAVAEIVGRQLAALGARGQVLCVTHLPQVAGQADHQIRVAKLTDGKSTRTLLTALGGDERVEELARMLGGVSITAKAREHAREMLKPPTPGKRARR